ncbi:MAG: YceI family protein [Myxococcales bacterium]|jgi:polyisoprenoid-binding protein YceI|nr:YceI family protein [Myxococcales bacterium]
MSAVALRAALALAVLATLTAVGCDDPAKDKSRATTAASQAVTVAAPSSGATELKFSSATGSKIAWVGSKVTGKHEGGFSDLKGTVRLVDGAPEKSSVHVDIDAASITSDAEKLTGHLKSPEFFDVGKFANITFDSTAVKAGGDKGATHTVTGNLALHGVTKAVTFPATIKIEGEGASVEAEFSLNRRDFELTYPGKKDDLIRDDVVVKLSVKAKK